MRTRVVSICHSSAALIALQLVIRGQRNFRCRETRLYDGLHSQAKLGTFIKNRVFASASTSKRITLPIAHAHNLLRHRCLRKHDRLDKHRSGCSIDKCTPSKIIHVCYSNKYSTYLVESKCFSSCTKEYVVKQFLR